MFHNFTYLFFLLWTNIKYASEYNHQPTLFSFIALEEASWNQTKSETIIILHYNNIIITQEMLEHINFLKLIIHLLRNVSGTEFPQLCQIKLQSIIYAYNLLTIELYKYMALWLYVYRHIHNWISLVLKIKDLELLKWLLKMKKDVIKIF